MEWITRYFDLLLSLSLLVVMIAVSTIAIKRINRWNPAWIGFASSITVALLALMIWVGGSIYL